MKLQSLSSRIGSLAVILAFLSINFEAHSQCTAPDMDLGPDTNVCAGTPVVLHNLNGFTYTNYLWDNGSQGQNRTVYVSGTYWLEGRTLGNNVVVNGDFEQGNVGFTTSYTVGTGGTYGQLSNEGTYAINSSPSNVHNNFASAQDHTPTPGTQMMIVNGSSTPNTTVWSQSVTIAPYTNYQFSVWAASAVSSPNLAQLQFSINNAPVGGTFSPSSSPGVWGNFFQIWNSGANTTATISIVNQATATSGNDFMIDDISLAPMCKTRDSIVVNIYPNPIVNLGADQTICLGSSTTLDAGANIDAYNWSTGDSVQNITIQTAGTYWVTATNGNLCTASDTIVIQTQNQINAGPDTSLVICSTQPNLDLQSAIPAGIDPSGVWEDIDNSTNGNLSISGSLSSNGLVGSFNCYYVLSDPYCPQDTAVYSVLINRQPNSGLDGFTHICNSTNQIDLNNLINPLTSASHSWKSDANVSATSFDENSAILDPNGLSRAHYSFKYIQHADSMCVNDTAIVVTRVSEVPVVDFGSQVIDGCSPIDVLFNDASVTAGNLDYSWDFGQGQVSNSQQPNTITYFAPGLYTVYLQIIADSLCSGDLTRTDYIEVYANPIANFQTPSNEILESSPIVDFDNRSINGDLYAWNFGDGQTSSDFEPQHTFPVEGTDNFVVSLIVTTLNGCIDSTFQVYTVERSTLVFIPNAFTPDGDQHNNVFIPEFSSLKGISDYHLQIFDRWGVLIFESQDPSIGWDGSKANTLVQEGAYNYKLNFYLAKDQKKHMYAGHLTLLR